MTQPPVLRDHCQEVMTNLFLTVLSLIKPTNMHANLLNVCNTLHVMGCNKCVVFIICMCMDDDICIYAEWHESTCCLVIYVDTSGDGCVMTDVLYDKDLILCEMF